MLRQAAVEELHRKTYSDLTFLVTQFIEFIATAGERRVEEDNNWLIGLKKGWAPVINFFNNRNHTKR